MSDDEFLIFARQNRAPSMDRQVRNILYGAISAVTGPDPSVVHADLARGRRALAQRRSRRRFLICLALAVALGLRLRYRQRPA
jgi:hypothetical protein